MKDDRTLQEKIEDTVEYIMRTEGVYDPKELIIKVGQTYGQELDAFVPDSRGRDTVNSWQEAVREMQGIIYCDEMEEHSWEMRGGRD